MVLINVRFESNHCMQVEAEDDWTVAQVKQQLQVKYNVPAADCRFVFLGRELADDVLIKVGSPYKFYLKVFFITF